MAENAAITGMGTIAVTATLARRPGNLANLDRPPEKKKTAGPKREESRRTGRHA